MIAIIVDWSMDSSSIIKPDIIVFHGLIYSPKQTLAFSSFTPCHHEYSDCDEPREGLS
jgi:hypothetical protein